MSEKRVLTGSVLHETGESWVLLNTTPGPLDHTGQVLYVDTGYPSISVVCVAGDKPDWTFLDTVLAFDATEGGIAKNPTPVLVMLGDQGPGVIPKVATFLEGVLKAEITYDRASRTYHLWYNVYGWTQNGGEVPTNRIGLSSKLYNENVAIDFNYLNWWVIPFRFDQFGPYEKAKTVLLHSTGTKVSLLYGENTWRTYLVFGFPEIIKYTDPLDNVTSGSCCVEIVKVTSGTPDAETGWYPAMLQYYDLVTRTWTNGDDIWVVDVNA